MATGAADLRTGMSASGLALPHHDGSELYVERLGDSAELRIRVPEGDAETVLLRHVRDGEARTVEASAATTKNGETWWRAELPLRNPLVSYRWLLAGGRGGYRWLNGKGLHGHEVAATDDFRIIASPGGPDWHLSSVVYEIFLDRFASSGTRHALPSWAVYRDWDRAPDPRARDRDPEIFGGDLLGVEQHLDHIESLGANVLWLTPFFPGETNHRYDPASFERVDPLLGGDDALASLVRAAHDRDMRLVGDLSLDHSGAGHDWFVRAQSDPESMERSLYLFDRFEAHGYATWFGYRELPRFDWRSPELRTRMRTVVRRWLDAGLDGWRLGAADSIGRYRSVDLNEEVAQLVRESAGDALLVAEYWNDFQPDLDGRGWHGVMDYGGFLRPVWWWLRGGDGRAFDIFSEAPAPSYDGHDLVDVMRASRVGVPWEATLHSWNLIESHDTPRFCHVAGSRDRHTVALGLQMTTPGVPMVYAGGEIGLEGLAGHSSRRTMPWGHQERWDMELLGEHLRLIALRRSCDALARGGIRYAHVSADAVAYLRESKLERLLCLAARAPHDPISVPFRNLTTLYGEDATDGTLPANGPAFHVWRIEG